MPEDVSAPMTVWRSEVVDRSVADHKSRYVNWLDARRFSAMFTDEKNAIIYDRQCVKRDTDIGGQNRRWQVL